MSMRKGFAAMDPERQREIASRGGKAAQAKGTGHKFTSDEARRAGLKGGRKGGRAVADVPGHMAKIGRRGGAAVCHRRVA